MEKHYKIFQIKDLHCPYIWRSYKRALENGFNLDDYEVVYDAHIDVDDYATDGSILDRLWVIFNVDHPGDYQARSLSVSDIIELDGVKYYVDSVGFVKVEE